jgi:hypothetical protein
VRLRGQARATSQASARHAQAGGELGDLDFGPAPRVNLNLTATVNLGLTRHRSSRPRLGSRQSAPVRALDDLGRGERLATWRQSSMCTIRPPRRVKTLKICPLERLPSDLAAAQTPKIMLDNPRGADHGEGFAGDEGPQSEAVAAGRQSP